jgi:hypothetical protein
VNLPQGVKEIRVSARSSTPQPIGFRVIDDSGQKHQFKKKLAGTGTWETVSLPLTKKTEHWGGAGEPLEALRSVLTLVEQFYERGALGLRQTNEAPIVEITVANRDGHAVVLHTEPREVEARGGVPDAGP